jgi:hypothetical protein
MIDLNDLMARMFSIHKVEETPEVLDALDDLQKLGLVKRSVDGGYGATKLGADYVKHLRALDPRYCL